MRKILIAPAIIGLMTATLVTSEQDDVMTGGKRIRDRV